MLAIRFVVLTAAMAAATWVVGWWAVPIVAAIYGVVARWSHGSALLAGIAGTASWGVLLGLTAFAAPVSRLAAILGGVLNVRTIAVWVLTLAYPGLLALTAALVARAIARVASPMRADATASSR